MARCALCLKERPLERSPFIPAGFYKLIRDTSQPNPNPIEVRGGRARVLSAPIRKRLLCKECEGILSKSEMRPDQSDTHRVKITRISVADYNQCYRSRVVHRRRRPRSTPDCRISRQRQCRVPAGFPARIADAREVALRGSISGYPAAGYGQSPDPAV